MNNIQISTPPARFKVSKVILYPRSIDRENSANGFNKHIAI